MVICLECDVDLHTAQLMPLPLTVSCFSKIHIDYTFLVQAHPSSPGKRAVERVCVSKTWKVTVVLESPGNKNLWSCEYSNSHLCSMYWLLEINEKYVWSPQLFTHSQTHTLYWETTFSLYTVSDIWSMFSKVTICMLFSQMLKQCSKMG